MGSSHIVPDLKKKSFARTNVQTIRHRAALIRELLPDIRSIAEICCGDCAEQQRIYKEELNIDRYVGLDIQPEIALLNRSRGIECQCGDALDRDMLENFLCMELIFFGPPLSKDCDGHNLLRFREVVPGFSDFSRLLLGELSYRGVLVCICPKITTFGDIEWFYNGIKSFRKNFGLRLIHKSYSTQTGYGEETKLRLKYVELWLSQTLGDAWETRESRE
jgi:hypothetical protein